MTEDQTGAARSTEGGPDTPSVAADERDAAVERLERALAEERKNSAALRDTVEKLRFQTETLEKSYAKQLADARGQAEAAEQKAAALEARIAEADAKPADTIKELATIRRELDLVTAERDRLRRELRSAGRPAAAGAGSPDDDDAPDGTINRLMADPAWLRERKETPSARLGASVGESAEEPVEVMLAPELVFTRRDKDDER